MVKNSIKTFGVIALLGLSTSLLAAASAFTIVPVEKFPKQVKIFDSSEAEYTVTNTFGSTLDLSFKLDPSIHREAASSQDCGATLANTVSCNIRLRYDASEVKSIDAGPMVCAKPGFLCTEPAADSDQIHMETVNPAGQSLVLLPGQSQTMPTSFTAQTKQSVVTLYNTAASDITINSASSDNADFAVNASANAFPLIIGAGKSAALNVSFTPSNPQATIIEEKANLSLSTSAGTQSLQLIGRHYLRGGLKPAIVANNHVAANGTNAFFKANPYSSVNYVLTDGLLSYGDASTGLWNNVNLLRGFAAGSTVSAIKVIENTQQQPVEYLLGVDGMVVFESPTGAVINSLPMPSKVLNVDALTDSSGNLSKGFFLTADGVYRIDVAASYYKKEIYQDPTSSLSAIRVMHDQSGNYTGAILLNSNYLIVLDSKNKWQRYAVATSGESASHLKVGFDQNGKFVNAAVVVTNSSSPADNHIAFIDQKYTVTKLPSDPRLSGGVSDMVATVSNQGVISHLLVLPTSAPTTYVDFDIATAGPSAAKGTSVTNKAFQQLAFITVQSQLDGSVDRVQAENYAADDSIPTSVIGSLDASGANYTMSLASALSNGAVVVAPIYHSTRVSQMLGKADGVYFLSADGAIITSSKASEFSAGIFKIATTSPNAKQYAVLTNSWKGQYYAAIFDQDGKEVSSAPLSGFGLSAPTDLAGFSALYASDGSIEGFAVVFDSSSDSKIESFDTSGTVGVSQGFTKVVDGATVVADANGALSEVIVTLRSHSIVSHSIVRVYKDTSNWKIHDDYGIDGVSLAGFSPIVTVDSSFRVSTITLPTTKNVTVITLAYSGSSVTGHVTSHKTLGLSAAKDIAACYDGNDQLVGYSVLASVANISSLQSFTRDLTQQLNSAIVGFPKGFDTSKAKTVCGPASSSALPFKAMTYDGSHILEGQ